MLCFCQGRIIRWSVPNWQAEFIALKIYEFLTNVMWEQTCLDLEESKQ